MFVFLWQFFIPLIVFVVAYWKILGVIRRQAKVAAAGQQTTPREPVAGTSGIAVEERNAGSSTDKNPKDRGGASRSQGTCHVGGQNRSKILSGAQINVVKTMVFVTFCFAICWMPLYINILRKLLTVRVRRLAYTVSISKSHNLRYVFIFFSIGNI